MISLKKYLDDADNRSNRDNDPEEKDSFGLAIAAYRSSLLEMGNCSINACPALGEELKQRLETLAAGLSVGISPKTLWATENHVRERLQDWGGRAATHYREKAVEVKEILLLLARTCESVGARDRNFAAQIDDVTTRLKSIANLDDLSQVRVSIEASAAELKASIGRMVTDGMAAIVQLQTEVAGFQAKLEEAELIASFDRLTGLRNRHSVEAHIEARMNAAHPFCVAILDIDSFKQVNDDYGHVVGDELLQMFATELKSRCRSTDIVGRLGGDEFIVLLDCKMHAAEEQTNRAKEWVCGNYTLHGKSGPMKLRVNASVGVAEYMHSDTMKTLIARADAEMYRQKAATRARTAPLTAQHGTAQCG